MKLDVVKLGKGGAAYGVGEDEYSKLGYRPSAETLHLRVHRNKRDSESKMTSQLVFTQPEHEDRRFIFMSS